MDEIYSGLWDIQKKYAEFRTCKTNHIRIRYLSFNLRGIRYFRILFLLSRRGIEREKDTGLRDLEPVEPHPRNQCKKCPLANSLPLSYPGLIRIKAVNLSIPLLLRQRSSTCDVKEIFYKKNVFFHSEKRRVVH